MLLLIKNGYFRFCFVLRSSPNKMNSFLLFKLSSNWNIPIFAISYTDAQLDLVSHSFNAQFLPLQTERRPTAPKTSTELTFYKCNHIENPLSLQFAPINKCKMIYCTLKFCWRIICFSTSFFFSSFFFKFWLAPALFGQCFAAVSIQYIHYFVMSHSPIVLRLRSDLFLIYFFV